MRGPAPPYARFVEADGALTPVAREYLTRRDGGSEVTEDDLRALEQRVTQNEADIAQNAADIATLRVLAFDNLVAAIYGNMFLDGTAVGADIGVGWTALDGFDTFGVTPRGVSLNLNGTFSFNQAGVYRLSLGLVFEHDDINQGRRTNLRIWDVTNGAMVGTETSIGTGRNVQVTQYSGNSLLEVSQAGVGDVFRFEIGGGDAYSSVVWLTQNLSINGVGEWRGPVPS